MTGAAALSGVRTRAVAWLLSRQHESGAWALPSASGAAMPSVAMTVLALLALGDDGVPEEAVDVGLDWLSGRQNPDGSFGDGDDGRFYRHYCTALALWVLPPDSERFSHHIAKAVACLRGYQRREGVDRGGFGHGMVTPAPTSHSPDGTFTRTFAMVSPTSMAAEGLRRVGVDPADPCPAGIVDYIRSCHNDPDVNTRPEVARFLAENGYCLGGDGGIVATLENLHRDEPWSGTTADPVVSTGISTYQGVSAYLRCGLPPESPEVQAAMSWIRSHYSVAEHAGFAAVMRAGQRPLWPSEHGGFDPASQPAQNDDLGQAGRYLYLFSMARALRDADVGLLETVDGVRHDWRAEIRETLHASQNPDGSWTNPNPRWLEFDAVLSTSFALSTVNVLA
jgi:hypothetical protein